LNRSVSEAVSSMHHVQTRPTQAQTQCGKPDASKMYVSDSVEDDTQYIQAITLHPHQFEGLQENIKSKESLLRNNYGNSSCFAPQKWCLKAHRKRRLPESER